MNSGIYEIVNTTNQHRYIGSAVDFTRRFREHTYRLNGQRHHAQPLQRAWNKYGAAAFEMHPIMLVNGDGLLQWEQKYLDEFKPEYNIALNAIAPMAGRKRTAESRARMSVIMKGKNVGKKHPPRTPEQCAQISARQKGVRRKPLSLEHKAKVSACHLGRKRSPETRARLSAAAFARYGNTTGVHKNPKARKQ